MLTLDKVVPLVAVGAGLIFLDLLFFLLLLRRGIEDSFPGFVLDFFFSDPSGRAARVSVLVEAFTPFFFLLNTLASSVVEEETDLLPPF